MKGWDLYIAKKNIWHYLKTYVNYKCLIKYIHTHKGAFLIESYERGKIYFTNL